MQTAYDRVGRPVIVGVGYFVNGVGDGSVVVDVREGVGHKR